MESLCFVLYWGFAAEGFVPGSCFQPGNLSTRQSWEHIRKERLLESNVKELWLVAGRLAGHMFYSLRSVRI